ncbi:putative chitinase 10 [Dermacentor variabilis]|uniref:putative chitinase 10 n=1 Tax=Dermacentor variabilis TaxID=34621 RepID=UPI003F5BD9CE
MCIVMTLVVMFALVVLLQTRMIDNASFRDLMVLRGVTAGRKRTGKFDLLEPDPGEDGVSKPVNATATAAAAAAAASAAGPAKKAAARRRPPSGSYLPKRVFDNEEVVAKDTAIEIVSEDADFPSTLLPEGALSRTSRSVCMVHGSRSGSNGRHHPRTCNSLELQPSDLPTHLCTDIVYCCFGLDQFFNVTTTPETLRLVQNLPRKTEVTRFWLAVGDGEASNGKFAVACRDEKSALTLAMNILSWLKAYDFGGVFLYWTYPSLQETQLHVKLLRLMKELYKLTGKLVGTVVPYEQQLREHFDMPALVALLAPYSILVTPPVTAAQQPSFARTFAPFKVDFLYKYNRILWETKDNILRKDGRYHLCYMTSLAGWSFTMARTTNRSNPGNMALGPGKAFPGSGQAGRLAFDDVCKATYEIEDDTKYSVVAISGRNFVSYMNPKVYRKVMHALANATKHGGCFGIWDMNWDDYCGFCGLGKFPFSGVLYNVLFESGRVK